MRKILYTLAIAVLGGTFAQAQSIIQTQPEGTLHESMMRSGEGYFFYLKATLPNPVSGQKTQIVVGNDGDFYIYNPFSQLNTKSWLKGTIDAEGNVTIPTPQPIYRAFEGTVVQDYYAFRMKSSGIPGDYKFELDKNNTDLHFTWKDNKLTYADEDAILGLGFIDGEFAGYADSKITIVPFTDHIISPANPNELEFTDYILGYSTHKEVPDAVVCKIAFDGQDVWVKDFMKSLPDAWLHGVKLDNGTIIFDSKQYLGLYENDLYAYFFGATSYLGENAQGTPETMYTLSSNSILEKSNNKFFSDDIMLINAGPDISKWIYVFAKPELSPYDNNAPRVPMSPRITSCTLVNPNESIGIGMFSAALDPLDSEGAFMNPENLYYSIFINDEEHPIELTKKDFPTWVNENTIDIPYTFMDAPKSNDWTILFLSNEISMLFHDKSWTRFGIQSVYKTSEVRKSPIVWSDDPVEPIDPIGIDEINTDTYNESDCIYFDLTGRQVENPQKGIYIVKLPNGKTFKKVIR